MRNKVGLLSFLFLLLGLCLAAPASAGDYERLHIAVNDELLQLEESQPFTYAEVAFAPVEPVMAALGVEAAADGDGLRLTQGERSLTLYAKQNKAVKSGGLEVPIWLSRSGVHVIAPIRYVAEYFGYTVTYLAEGPVVRIADSSARLTDEQLQAKLAAIWEEQKEAQKPPIYLTFDDGPTKHTTALVNVLGEYNAKATFFMLGSNITGHPQAVSQLVEAGHGIGLHSYTHRVELFYAAPASALAEMNQANRRLEQTVGITTRLIRTPYGSKPSFTQAYRDKTAQARYRLWDWNVDSEDWKYPGKPDFWVSHVLSQVRSVAANGKAPIVLMHDQETTISALPKLLSALRDEGY